MILLVWSIIPRSAGDLPNYNDGTTGTINVGTVNARTNINAASGTFTNSLSVTGQLTVQQGSSTGVTITNSASQVGLSVNQFAGSTADGADFLFGGTNEVRFQLGTTSIPQIGLRDNNTGIGTPGAERVCIYSNGGVVAQFDNTPQLLLRNTMYLGFSSGIPPTAADAYLVRENTGILQLGLDNATATDQTLKSADGTGTDKSGDNFIIASGQSTGNGVPGDLIYRTSLYTNGSGSTANAYTTRGQIVGRPCALTNATATSFQRFTMATNTQAGIRLFCTVKATDAAFARQSISSDVRVDAVNVNGTITATVSETDNTLASSTGTLTIAYTVVDEGSNVLAIRANANTSLTATPSIKWVIQSINSDGAITVTPVQL